MESDFERRYKGSDMDFPYDYGNKRLKYEFTDGFFKNYFRSYNIFGHISLDKCNTKTAVSLATNHPTYKDYMIDVMESSNSLIWIILLPIASIVWFFQNLTVKRWLKNNTHKLI